ncbi:pyrroline-5-carboxylate reductase [Mesosutterella sp. OilRF-GAM-744-9]|uniref:Pyrroline-5-carboxylate reductase n=1 Tax=Mesosutterella porci TaxID=2915351 RepID=A0ABS9MS44_9BURK|nr:pyrroline-5-carboxylate reductase [Mesosutterella sp. oilRF-744-WT-GAM-9]MCG5031456.1 pyrroline-5-carboxylate reductase [Mesosutterella sp. oilRF-744-WT-GAM-9]
MKLGVIGAGNMGRAIISGILSSGLVNKNDVIASNATEASRNETVKLGIAVSGDNADVARAENLLIAVKPARLSQVIGEIAPVVKPSTLVISVAAGTPIAALEELFGRQVQIVRAMPNTPALVREGMTALCANSLVSEESFAWVQALFATCGRVEVVPEPLMDAVGTVSGASPAWVYMLIEAMADGAVRDGMPRAQAYKFAAQSVLGAAKMVLETGLHPGALKDQVTSPAGTTIEALKVLEQRGFRGAVIEAMGACTEKSRRMAAAASAAGCQKKAGAQEDSGRLSSLLKALKG